MCHNEQINRSAVKNIADVNHSKQVKNVFRFIMRYYIYHIYYCHFILLLYLNYIIFIVEFI